jgi:DNA-binding response OmpR family regulator
MLPDIDGLEGCRRLKADPGSSAIPIVFLSARSDPPDVKAGMDAGADGYLTKPFDPVVLSQRITAILKDRDEHAGQPARKAPRGRRRRR